MSNIITSLGVFLILVAFFGNAIDKLSKGKVYYWLNIVGSILAGYGAYSVALWPTVLLEIVWTCVSFYELFTLKSK
jgi:hypothetical protein